MTVTALGLGIPGGAIGPILGIGAVAGGCAAIILQMYFPTLYLTHDLALMGMAGMMAATLNAPLAALITVVELSNQLEIIVPAMIVIGTACIISGQFFGNRSLFVMQLEVQNLIYRKPPLEKSLQRVGVLGVMKENFKIASLNTDNEKIELLSKLDSTTILIEKTENAEAENHLYYLIQQEVLPNKSNSLLVLTQQVLIPLSAQASLVDAYALLEQERKGAVYIYGDNIDEVLGIITFEQIRQFLVEGKIG
jgi:hypothetical protein